MAVKDLRNDIHGWQYYKMMFIQFACWKELHDYGEHHSVAFAVVNLKILVVWASRH